jgi:hypothetical protein
VQRSIATPSSGTRVSGLPVTAVFDRFRLAFAHSGATYIGLFFVTLALGIYVFSNPSRSEFYNHFVWQADAFWHGRFVIAYPVESGPFTNAYFQDVMPLPAAPGEASYALLPFPPLPAIVLMPFVALFGLATQSQLVGVVLGAINVGLAWRMTTRITSRTSANFLATLFFGFGTVVWYASMLSTTWFLAHVVAITFLLLAMTLAFDAEAQQNLKRRLEHAAAAYGSSSGPLMRTFEESSLFLGWFRRLRGRIDPLQFMAGFVFGVAALARLPIIFGAPFFLFVGGGGSFFKRGLSAGIGAAIPIGLLLIYNVASSGHIFNPAYEHLYQTEYLGYLPPSIGECLFGTGFCSGLTIDRSLGIEDIGHVPLNALIMLGWLPIIPPGCGITNLGECAGIRPDPIGMSVLLTSPAYLLAVPLVIAAWRNRMVAGSVLAIGAIAFINLMHFSQGWVQFGYRFSNDFAPFALVLVTLAIARFHRHMWLSGLLVAGSIIINAWGVYWGVKSGW